MSEEEKLLEKLMQEEDEKFQAMFRIRTRRAVEADRIAIQ
jgi:hypothetical protein